MAGATNSVAGIMLNAIKERQRTPAWIALAKTTCGGRARFEVSLSETLQ
jgi:hypothetical protein